MRRSPPDSDNAIIFNTLRSLRLCGVFFGLAAVNCRFQGHGMRLRE